MIYDIANNQYDAWHIRFNNGVEPIYVPKGRIYMTVDEPYLTITWTDSEMVDKPSRSLTMDFNDVTPPVASAADLKVLIDGYNVAPSGITPRTVTTQTGDYTLVLADANSIINIDSADLFNTVTIPTDADEPFEIGEFIWIVWYGNAMVRILGDVGVTVNAPDGDIATRVQFSTVRLQKIATDEWELAEDVGPFAPYDPVAQAYIDATVAEGGSFDDTEAGLINDFCLTGTADGWLAKTHFCHLYMGGDIDSMKLNLVNPVDSDAAHRLTTSGSPTVDANGITTNGSSNYVNLHYIPTTDASLNNKAYAFYFRSVGAGCNFGAVDGAFAGDFLIIDIGGVLYWELSTATETGVLPVPDYGFYLMNRTGSTAADLRQNDVSIDTDTSATTAQAGVPLVLGARNSNGAINVHSADNFCFDWGGESLDSGEATSLYNACVTLQTALSRNV